MILIKGKVNSWVLWVLFGFFWQDRPRSSLFLLSYASPAFRPCLSWFSNIHFQTESSIICWRTFNEGWRPLQFRRFWDWRENGFPKVLPYPSFRKGLSWKKVFQMISLRVRKSEKIKIMGDLVSSDGCLGHHWAVIVSLDDNVPFIVKVWNRRNISLWNLVKSANVISIEFVFPGFAPEFNEGFAHFVFFLEVI